VLTITLIDLCHRDLEEKRARIPRVSAHLRTADTLTRMTIANPAKPRALAYPPADLIYWSDCFDSLSTRFRHLE